MEWSQPGYNTSGWSDADVYLPTPVNPANVSAKYLTYLTTFYSSLVEFYIDKASDNK